MARFSSAVALATVLALTLAYQVCSVSVLDVGGDFDRPYVTGFYPEEDDGAQTYRWTRGNGWLTFGGLGLGVPLQVRVRLNGYRPDRPAQGEWHWSGAAAGEFQAYGDWRIYRFEAASGGDPLTGDTTLNIKSDVLLPRQEIEGSTDPRRLGVAIDWVELAPVRSSSAIGTANYWVDVGGPLVIPPVLPVAAWAASLALWYAIARGLGLPDRPVALASALLVLLTAVLFALARLYIANYTLPFLALTLALLPVALALHALVPRWLAWLRAPLAASEWAVLGMILLGLLALKLGGVLFPQFRSSDLLFHVHRLEFIAQGNLFFTSQLPDAAQRVVPYPPALYVWLSPLVPLTGRLDLLLLAGGLLADIVVVLATYYAARRLWPDSRMALFAAFLAAFNPVSFWIYSWGNYTNIFGQGAATALFALLLTQPLDRARVFLLALFLFLLASLAHLGVLLSLLAFLPLLILAQFIKRNPFSRRTEFATKQSFARKRVSSPAQAVALLALLAAGVALAWLIYYAEFTGPLVDQVGRFASDFSAGRASGRAGSLSLARLHDWMRVWVSQSGIVQLALGLIALPLVWRALGAQARTVYFAWLAAGLAFAFVALGSSFSTRYTLWLIPALALGGGAALAAWFTTRRTIAWPAYALCALALVQTVWQWLDRVLFAYR